MPPLNPIVPNPETRPVTSVPGATSTDQIYEPKRGFDFRHYWHALRERIWIVVLCVIAGLFLALGYLARTPKLYQGHIVLEVQFQEPSYVAATQTDPRMRSMFLASQEALRTIEQNFTNRSLMSRIVRAEGLADDGGRALLGQKITAQTDSTPTPPRRLGSKKQPDDMVATVTFTPLEEALGGALATMVKPVIRRGTRLIDLYVTNRDPAMAQRLAEAVGREYIRYSIEQRSSFTQGALRYLVEEEERLKKNLQRSEAAVADYKEKTPDALQLGGGAASTGSQQGASGSSRGGLVEDKLQELNTKLTAAKSERIRIENEIKQVEGIGENIDALLAIPSIATAQLVSDRRRDVSQLEAAVGALAQRYKDKHPKMIAARAALSEAREALRRTVLDQPNVLRNVLEQAKSTEASLEAAVEDQEKAALALNKAAIGYQQLARQAETDRALYESVLRQIKETDLTKDAKMTAVSVVEHAPLPHSPVSPSSRKAIALGLLGGLAVSLAFVFGADAIDRSIKTVDQAEATFALPVLAAIPETARGDKPKGATRRKGDGAHNYRVVAERPEGPAAESFRNLRAALSLLGPEAERKVTLFTSALPSEGKSFTSANYSVSLAQQGYRVLLMDGDLRRPSIHKIFLTAQPNGQYDGNMSEGEQPIGVVDCLIGRATLDTAARPVSAEEIDIAGEAIAVTGNLLTMAGGQLFVLTSGQRAPNPAEILSGPSFAELVKQAIKLFDRVVIDSAPILAVSDTLLMVPHVQTVCMVIRAAKSPRPAIQRAIALLGSAGTRPAGLILNRLPKHRGAGYYYYYASPGYGKGEGSYSSTYREQAERAAKDNGA